MKTKYLIATATKPKGDDNFKELCGLIRSSAEEHELLKVTGGITWVPGPGCNNLAFEIEGDEAEAEKFVSALTMALMPAKWTTTSDEIPEQDTWVK